MIGRSGLWSALASSADAIRTGGGAEAIKLQPNGWVPNNVLPVLHYRGALGGEGPKDRASAFEALFARNGWPPDWRNGVYGYHHYHSTAHEALGIVAGTAKLVLGGPGGVEVDVRPDDVIVLPVGTGHCRITASGDFLVIGAYPRGQRWDICRDAPTAEMTARMQSLPCPTSDPVAGENGPLASLWQRS
jgi:uncharacterized protein YjlB